MTNDEIVMDYLILFLALFIVGMVIYMIVDHIKDRREEKKRKAEYEEQRKNAAQNDTPRYCGIRAIVQKCEADKCGMDYAFGRTEYEEREKISDTIKDSSIRGLYSCELDFPVSQRSLEWLKYSGFEVSQSDGKTLVSWKNAGT